MNSVTNREDKGRIQTRDQLTHFAHGLWLFCHSPLSDETQREGIRNMLTNLSARLFMICSE